jgi:hypothetical protein
MSTPAAAVNTATASWLVPTDALVPSLKFLRVSMWSRVINARIPVAGDITRRLAWHLSPEFPHPGDMPMLHVCLKHAFEWADATIQESSTAYTGTVLTAYLAGLFYATPALAEVQARVGKKIWNPLKDEALCEWRQRYGPITFTFVEPPAPGQKGYAKPHQIRAALLARLLSAAELSELQAELPLIFSPET